VTACGKNCLKTITYVYLLFADVGVMRVAWGVIQTDVYAAAV
jgi:hypothetical protein